MKKRVKKKDKLNINNISGTQIDTTANLRNYTGRPWPMAPKAGVTLVRRRYQLGGKCGR